MAHQSLWALTARPTVHRRTNSTISQSISAIGGHFSVFSVEFVLRMRRNCNFRASDRNCDTAVRFGDPISYTEKIFCRLVGIYYVTLTFDPLTFIYIIHIHTTLINSGRAHTTQHRTHCGLWLRLQSWLMPQSLYRLRNDLKYVEWDVKPCSVQSNLWPWTFAAYRPWHEKTVYQILRRRPIRG